MNPVERSPSLARLHHSFETILPTIERRARIMFHWIKCPSTRADRIADTIAVAWKWFARMAEKGKDGTPFAKTLAFYAARYVKGGRRLCGSERLHEPLSYRAQHRHSFRVEPLSTSRTCGHEQRHGRPHCQQEHDECAKSLRDNMLTPIPDQVCFQLDFPAWLQTLTAREHRLVQAMLRYERNQELSQQFEVSSARISQLRRRFRQDWSEFCGDDPSI